MTRLMVAAASAVALTCAGGAVGQTCRTLGPQPAMTFADTSDAAVAAAQAGVFAPADPANGARFDATAARSA